MLNDAQEMLGCAAVIALAAVASAPPTATADQRFVGVTWDGCTVAVDPTTGSGSLIGPSGFDDLNSMAKDETGRLVTAFHATAGTPRLVEIHSITGEGEVFHVPFLNEIRAMAFQSKHVLYAIDGTVSDLYWLDLTVPFGDSGIRNFVGTSPIRRIQGMTFAPDGTLYGWSTSAGLVELDPLTADATNVNDKHDGSSAIQSLAVGPGDRLYGLGDALYEINVETGARSLIGTGDYGSVRGFELAAFCAEDVDGSGEIGFSDLLRILGAWGSCEGCPEDLDHDGVVGFADLLLVLGTWGPCT